MRRNAKVSNVKECRMKLALQVIISFDFFSVSSMSQIRSWKSTCEQLDTPYLVRLSDTRQGPSSLAYITQPP